MSTLSNLKVSTKLSLGFGFLVLLMLTIGIVSYNAMSGITNRMGDVIDDKVPKLEAIASINYKVLDIARSLRNALLEADDSEKMEGHIKRVLENRQEIKETLERLDPKVTLPEGRRLLKDIIDARTAFVQGQEAVIRLLREKKTAEAKEFLLTEMRKRQGAYAAATGALQDFQKKVLHETGAAAQATAASASTTMLVAFLVSVMLAVVIAWLIIRDIVGQLGGEPAYAADHVRHIALGDLSRRIETRPGDQGSLLVSLQQMQEGLARLVGEIREMVAAAAQGDFTRRIDLRGKHGFGKEIGESLNQLAETTDTGLADVVRVAKALAGGDLSQRIDKHYPGVFGETGKAVNATVEALKRIVSDIEAIAQAAAQGDFSLRADLAGKQGFARELSALLNQLSDTTESGLKDVMRVANTLARGDLTQVIDKDYPGLFGETRSGINATVANLGTLVVQIKEAVAAINVAAGEIAAGNQDLSSRTEEQASSLEETASSMEELNATVKNNTQSATLARTEALAATEVARRGGETVRVSMEAMAGIAESSNRIADIIGVIDGIAFQTNILALNAAVEAARAGEQGRGFAVVATEVRNLAQRSADAAKEIKGLIADSVARVEAGTSQAQAAGKQMGEIVAAIDKVSALISDIASASQEQASGIDQISLAVTQMDEVTQQNAALVEEAAAAAESLQEQAMHLATAVAVFRMAEGEGHRPLVPTAPRSGKAGGRSPARLAAPAKRLTLVATGDAESAWAEF